MGVFIGGVHGGVCPGGVPCANACDPGDETCVDDVVAGPVARPRPSRRVLTRGASFGARSLAAQVSIGVETNCAGILLSVKQNCLRANETLSEPKEICPAYTDERYCASNRRVTISRLTKGPMEGPRWSPSRGAWGCGAQAGISDQSMRTATPNPRRESPSPREARRAASRQCHHCWADVRAPLSSVLEPGRALLVLLEEGLRQLFGPLDLRRRGPLLPLGPFP
jgi:hypothetical protein